MKSLFKTLKRVCVGAPTKEQKREIHLAQTDKFSSNHNADKFAPEFQHLQQQLADERMHRERLEWTRYEKLSKNLTDIVTDIQIAMKELCTKFSIGEIVAPPSPDGEDHFHRAASRTASRSASGAIKPYRKSSPVESAGGVGSTAFARTRPTSKSSCGSCGATKSRLRRGTRTLLPHEQRRRNSGGKSHCTWTSARGSCRHRDCRSEDRKRTPFKMACPRTEENS